MDRGGVLLGGASYIRRNRARGEGSLGAEERAALLSVPGPPRFLP